MAQIALSQHAMEESHFSTPGGYEYPTFNSSALNSTNSWVRNWVIEDYSGTIPTDMTPRDLVDVKRAVSEYYIKLHDPRITTWEPSVQPSNSLGIPTYPHDPFYIVDDEDIFPLEALENANQMTEEITSGSSLSYAEVSDFRTEFEEKSVSPRLLHIARSSAVIVDTVDNLQASLDGRNESVTFEPISTYGAWNDFDQIPFCNPSPEPQLGLCSSVFVKLNNKPVLLTAGHCLRNMVGRSQDEQNDKPVFAVFDFLMENWNSGADQVLSRKFARLDLNSIRMSENADLATVELLPSSHFTPHPIEIGDANSVTEGEFLFSIGFPLARPKKIVIGPGMRIQDVKTSFLYSFIDNFKHSSGSPVFDFDGNLLGLLTNQTVPLYKEFMIPEAGGKCTEEVVTMGEFAIPTVVTRITPSQLPG